MPVPQITGQLPFQGLTNQSVQFQGLGGTPQQAMQQLGTNYANAYNSAISMNEANYGNILQGYQDVRANQGTAQDAISGGYTDLYNQLASSQQGIMGGYSDALKGLQTGGRDLASGYAGLNDRVLGGIQNIGQSRAQDIDLGYTAQSAQLGQDMVTRGLGNSTVQGAMQRGIQFDRQRAQNANSEQIAGLRAGYQSQLGLAGLGSQQQQMMSELGQRNVGLGYQNQAAMQLANQGQQGLGYRQQALMNDTGLAQNQLQWMNSVNSPYPDAGMYANLAQMYGAQQQQPNNNARDQWMLGQAQRELQRNSGVNPAMMQMPGFSRGSGGGPPPSIGGPSSGGGLFGLGGAGGGGGMAPRLAGAGGGGGGMMAAGIGGGAFGGGASFDYGNQTNADALGALWGGAALGAGLPVSDYGNYDQPFDEFGYYDEVASGGAGGYSDAYSDYFPQEQSYDDFDEFGYFNY